ncbi:hypothetical protein [Rhodoplanes elegans]|uniref:hypothetical protein n=1 Tax=Rhodoplanes elegans TaxID=29408 RepID=UPI001911CA13|nr:hypothetical protein [Rhodoplanes elegans]
MNGTRDVPKRRGFGSRVLEKMVGQALLGRAELRLEPTAAVWSLEALHAHVVGTEA